MARGLQDLSLMWRWSLVGVGGVGVTGHRESVDSVLVVQKSRRISSSRRRSTSATTTRARMPGLRKGSASAAGTAGTRSTSRIFSAALTMRAAAAMTANARAILMVPASAMRPRARAYRVHRETGAAFSSGSDESRQRRT
jgi:hypothetical protein